MVAFVVVNICSIVPITWVFGHVRINEVYEFVEICRTLELNVTG